MVDPQDPIPLRTLRSAEPQGFAFCDQGEDELRPSSAPYPRYQAVAKQLCAEDSTEFSSVHAKRRAVSAEGIGILQYCATHTRLGDPSIEVSSPSPPALRAPLSARNFGAASFLIRGRNVPQASRLRSSMTRRWQACPSSHQIAVSERDIAYGDEGANANPLSRFNRSKSLETWEMARSGRLRLITCQPYFVCDLPLPRLDKPSPFGPSYRYAERRNRHFWEEPCRSHSRA